MRGKSFLDISEEIETAILERFGKEPEKDEDGHVCEYTEQDLWEQIRKMINPVTVTK